MNTNPTISQHTHSSIYLESSNRSIQKLYRQRAAHIRPLKINNTTPRSLRNSSSNSSTPPTMRLRNSQSSLSLTTMTTTGNSSSIIKKSPIKKSSSFSSHHRYMALSETASFELVTFAEEEEKKHPSAESETHSTSSLSSITVTSPNLSNSSAHEVEDFISISTTVSVPDLLLEDHLDEEHIKHVSFQNVHIRCYNQILGDHPCCISGPPLALGWNYTSTMTMNLESYEVEYRGKEHPRRYGRDLKLDDAERRDILLRHPCSSTSLNALESMQQNAAGEMTSIGRQGLKKRSDIDEKWHGCRHAATTIGQDDEEEEDSDEKEQEDISLNQLENHPTTTEEEEETPKTTRIRLREDRVVFFHTAPPQPQQLQQLEEESGYSEQEMKRLERKLYRQRCTRSRWQSDFFEPESTMTNQGCDCSSSSSDEEEAKEETRIRNPTVVCKGEKKETN